MEKALNNNSVILGIRKLGENMNKEAILYRMNAREKVDAERKWKRKKFSVAIFSQNVHTVGIWGYKE